MALDENAVRLLAQEECDKKLEEGCPLKHDKMTSEINSCITKKFNEFWKALFFRGALALIILVIAQLIIVRYFK